MNLCDYYDTYWRDKGDLFDRERLAQMAALVQPGEHVLALDCGPGVLARLLADKGATVVGVDMSAVAVDMARQKGIDAHWVDLDREPLPFADECFDVVLSDSGLEHRFFVDRPLDEAVRVLQPGGRFILSVPNLGHWRCRLWLLAGRFPYMPNSPTDAIHLRFFTLREAKALLRQRRLTIQATDGTVCLWAWQFYPAWLRWPVVRDVYAWLAHHWPGLFGRDVVVVGRKAG